MRDLIICQPVNRACVCVCESEISEDKLGDEDDLPGAVTDHTLNCSLSVIFCLPSFFSLFQICLTFQLKWG